MHCLDHIREDLMCNADVELAGTSDYYSFNTKPEKRRCRDLGAIQDWVRRHRWIGQDEYWETVLGFNATRDKLVKIRLKELADAGVPWNEIPQEL